MYLFEKMDDDDDDEQNEFESKFINEINCISHVEIKEEVIIPENTSDGESTLSDNEKNSDNKLEECVICCKYQSMFIILKNHDCQSDSENCKFCAEISHWLDCFKMHKESHQLKKESDHSSESTASDSEENEEKCKVCLKYEFMVPLLKSHICQSGVDSTCSNCSEVLHWMSCHQKHVESHEPKNIHVQIKEENFSDSTISDNEEIQSLLSSIGKLDCEKCQICLKYQGMFIILEENHMCDVEKPNKNCEKCNEIIQWYSCFDKHKKTHRSAEESSIDKSTSESNFLHFGGKFDCGICLKLNSIVMHLVKNHKCIDNKACSICQEVSYWLSCLKNHKQAETISDLSECEELQDLNSSLGQETDCAVCSKFRTTIVNLSEHVCCRNRGRHKCEICLEVSFWFKNFKLHENHHSKQVTPHRNFLSCSNCGKRFTGQKMLNVHKSYCKSSHFACDICNRKFVNMFSLKKHKIFQLCRSPSISIQYKCRICKKTFSNSSEWENHENFHDLNLFKCGKAVNEFESKIY